MVVTLVVPVAVMLARSVNDPSIANYTNLAESDLFRTVFLRTLRTSLMITASCLLLAYPYAYAMVRVGPRARLVLMAAALMPFWTSWLVRTFAWMSLLRDTGLINDTLQRLGLIDQPLPLIRNVTGVVIGMTYILVPFMIFPLYASMTRMDWSLVRAARSLGASPRQAFLRVFLPLTLPGVAAGSVLVFVIATGFYVTPALLGGPSHMLVGELIITEFQTNLRFGAGSAMGVVLLAVVLLLLALAAKVGPVAPGLGATASTQNTDDRAGRSQS